MQRLMKHRSPRSRGKMREKELYSKPAFISLLIIIILFIISSVSILNIFLLLRSQKNLCFQLNVWMLSFTLFVRYCMFNQYRIPKSYLLSKIGSVNEEGQYVSPIKDPRKRFGLFFILSACFMCCLWRGILNVHAFIALLRVFKVFFYNTLNFYNKV